jgi:hypothetical protein
MFVGGLIMSAADSIRTVAVADYQTPLLELGSYIRAARAFATPLGTHAAFPEDI